MKRAGIILAIIIIFGITIFGIYQHTLTTKPQKHYSPPTPTSQNNISSPTQANTEAFCEPSALQAHISLEPAAGNIYGTLTLKNTASTSCQIIGNNKLEAVSAAKNITLSYEGEGQKMLHLQPQQTVYSKVHYPNGPQCNGPAKNATITFLYAVSPTSTITFANNKGISQQNIFVCDNSTLTEVTLWSFSTTPY